MKILKIIIKNLNSLAGKHVLDFTQPEFQDGIFAIVGETGAGKTTILDAITISLYGKAVRTPERTNYLTFCEKELLTEVWFEVKDKIYISSFSQKRTARKNSKRKIGSPKMELARANGKILESSISKVPKMIEEIIGLNFEQFTKSILLAQGSFDAFLKASSNEKGTLLEKLTNTEIYSELSIKVFEKNKELKTEIEFLEKNILQSSELHNKIIGNTALLNKLKDEYKKIKLDEKQKKIENIKNYRTIFQQSKLLKNNILKLKETLKLEKDFLSKNSQRKNQAEQAKELDLKINELKKQTSLIKIKNINLETAEKRINELEVFFKNQDSRKLLEKYHYFQQNIFHLIKNSDHFQNQTFNLNEFLELEKYLSKVDKEFLEIIYSLENLNQKIENNKSVVDKLIEDLKQIRNEKKTLTQIIVQLEEKYETERILFEYQKQREVLKDGDQCPLCGAKVEIEILNQLIKKTANISETNKLLKTNKTNLNKLQAQEEKLKIKIFNIFSELNLLENIAVEKNDVFIQKIKQGFKLETEKYPEVNLELKNYTTKNNRFHFLKELKEFLDFKKSLEEELKIFNLEANENGLNKLKQIKNDFHKKQQGLIYLQQDLHLLEFKEELKTLQKIRENIFGKEDPTKFLEKLNEKTNLVLQLKTEIETKQDQLINLEMDLKKYQDGDLDKLLDEVQKLQKKQQELIKEIGGIEREIKIDKIRLAENINREKILNEKKTEFEKWSKLNELIGSAKGDKFKVIAQQLTLESLTDFANKYLHQFNNRYLLETSKEKLDVLIKDIFYSGIIRPIQTLSGGETFIVSLSLALALSDLVSEKVMINSLFLDEGFGTLDENSLDIVLSALGNLQSEGKIIGVISHVKNLRERISTQIQVKKIGSGKSKIVLVNSFE